MNFNQAEEIDILKKLGYGNREKLGDNLKRLFELFNASWVVKEMKVNARLCRNLMKRKLFSYPINERCKRFLKFQ